MKRSMRILRIASLVLEGPTSEQKAAAREVDRRMNYEEINESPADRLGETRPATAEMTSSESGHSSSC